MQTGKLTSTPYNPGAGIARLQYRKFPEVSPMARSPASGRVCSARTCTGPVVRVVSCTRVHGGVTWVPYGCIHGCIMVAFLVSLLSIVWLALLPSLGLVLACLTSSEVRHSHVANLTYLTSSEFHNLDTSDRSDCPGSVHR